MPKKIKQSCPVCGSSHEELIFEPWVNESDPAKLYGAASGIPGTQSIVKCIDCGMIFESPRYDAATIRDFVSMAFKAIDIHLEFKGKGKQEIAIEKATGKTLMKVNPKFYRPAEVELLIGDPSKAKAIIGWEPKTQLEELCSMMVKADITRNKNGASF